MQSHAFKTNNFQEDSSLVMRKSQKAAHLYLASISTENPPASEYGPDLGLFEEQYLLGYACFA